MTAPNVIPWSFSSLTKFETCPRQFYLTRIARVVTEQETEAIRWGNLVHDAIEKRIKGEAPLPEAMAVYEPILVPIINGSAGRDAFTERSYTLTRNLTPTEWRSNDAWTRCRIDAGIVGEKTAVLFDWKTGKVKSELDQLIHSSAVLMTSEPRLMRVAFNFVWLKFNRATGGSIKRSDLPEIWKGYNMRVQRLLNAVESNKWVPQPSGLCRGWCPVGREHCNYWEPKRERV